MDNKEFVNKAFTVALTNYLDSKNKPDGVLFNSFYAVIIRLLVVIYDEEDILNAYYALSEEDFERTLKKYDYHIDDILKFKHAMEDYFNKETSDGFIFIQKSLVDMFMCKKNKIDIDINEVMEFRNLLYSPLCDNPLRVSYNFLMANRPNEVVDYFDDSLTTRSVKKYPRAKEILNMEAYQLLNYSMDDIKNMNPEELYKVNEEVYEFFDINRNNINKGYLLDKAVFDYKKNNNKLQYSTGHINIMFILGIILVLAFVIAVLTIFIL